MADVNTQLTGSGKEIGIDFKFNISWVREALTAVGITVDDLRDNSECKNVLIETINIYAPRGGVAPKSHASVIYRTTELTARGSSVP